MKKEVIIKIVLGLLGVLFFFYILKEAKGNGDFKIYLEAARLALSGETPYGKWIYVSEGNTGLYYYSQFWCFLLIPLTFIPQYFANLIWLLLNVFFIYRTWKLVLSYISNIGLKKKQINWILILSVALGIRFILYNFDMIQMTIFLLWGMFEGLRFIEKKYILAGALLISIVINIKLLPIVILPYLVYRSKFKASIFIILFSVVWLYLPAIVWGLEFNHTLLSGWWSVINPSNNEHLIEIYLGTHSLMSLIPTLLTSTEGGIPYQRNILDLSPESAILITNLFRLVLVLFSVYFLKWPPFIKRESKLSDFRALSYLFLLIPLIFPHQQKYAFYLMSPAVVYILTFMASNLDKEKRAISSNCWKVILTLLIIFFLLTTATTDGLIGRELNNITQHYKLITYGALTLIPLLILCKPKSIIVSESSVS